MNTDKSLKQGMLSVLMANVFNLCISLMSSFILPEKLSIVTYATIKTFQLYASYAGLFHFGYVDGIYLKYGGKKISEIRAKCIDESLCTVRIFQTIVSFIVMGGGIITKSKILVVFGVSILPANMVAYFKSIYQAVGKFDIYSRVLNGTTLSYFVLNLLLIFVLKTDNPYWYMLVFVVVDFVLWIILEIYIRTEVKIKWHYLVFSTKEFVDNVKNGILLTLGNFSSILFTGMDRWFIKILLDASAFAQYSFAVSMENILNVAVTPICVTMYNYFCHVKNGEKIKGIRNQVSIFAAFLISCAFLVKFVIENFLNKYQSAISVVFILFGAQLFYIVIKSIYINIYKANGQQKQYFVRLILVIVIGAVFNIVFYQFYKEKEAFAVGTLMAAVFWFFLCVRDFRDIRLRWNEVIYLFMQEIIYLFCGMLFPTILGFVVYVVFTCIFSSLMLKEDFEFLWKNSLDIVKKIMLKSN